MSNANCQNCGSSIPANAPAGICPRCTLGLAMGDQSPSEKQLASTAMGRSFIAPPLAELQRHFQNLEIIELLGHGGMGAVYKARQKNLDRLVALKILAPGLTNDPSFAQRFTREARTLAKLTHPNIVMVFEYGTVGDLHYLLMEFVEGVDLRTAMRQGSLQPEQALPVVQQVCEALQYAHDQGIVHRDIKPENILLGRQSAVKIADFGLAKLVQSESCEHSLTGTQQVVGTRNYMAPEQIETPTRVDHRADIYSLGVVFYEMLTGELPLGRFAAPSEKAKVNSQLDEVVMRALEKEPDRRYQKASQVQTAVESIESQPQASHRRRAPEPAADRETETVLRVPFSIPNVYGGFALAHGIAHFDGSVIELEFQVKDALFGAISSKAQRIQLPVRELFDAEFKASTLTGAGRLVVTATHLDAIDQVPNQKQGQFALHIKKDNRRQAEEFAGAVVRGIHSGPGPVKRPPPAAASSAKPWEKVFVMGIGAKNYRFPAESPLQKNDGHEPAGRHDALERPDALRNMRGPALGLLATGLLNALVAVALWISFMAGTMSWVGSLADDLPAAPSPDIVAQSAAESAGASTVVEVATAVEAQSDDQPSLLDYLVQFLDNFSIGTFVLSAAMAVLLIFASQRMLHLRDYQFCIFASVLAVIPLHSAAPLGIGFGIWALVMLSRPEIKRAFSSSAPVTQAATGPPDKNSPPEDRPLAESIRAPAIVLLKIFQVLLIVAVCLLFSFGLILLITRLAGWFGTERDRPARIATGSSESISVVEEQIESYEERLEERIEEFMADDEMDQQAAAGVADQIEQEIDKEFDTLQQMIVEMKKSAKSGSEIRELNALAKQLEIYRDQHHEDLQKIDIDPPDAP